MTPAPTPTPTPHAAHPHAARDDRAGPPDARGEVRLSTITGDRVCTRCAFNLCGQSIVREPHYGMLMVRCPECGTAAALNEYPMLGKWGNRWAVLFAAAWFAVVMVGAILTAALFMGIAGQTSAKLLDPLAVRIATLHREHWERVIAAEAEMGPPVTGTATAAATTAAANNWIVQNAVSQPPGSYAYIDAGWWKDQDAGAIVSAMGGAWKALKFSEIWSMLPMLLFPLLAGMLWAVALMHVRRRRLPIMCAPIVALACLWVWWIMTQQAQTWWGGTASQMASGHLGWPVSIGCLAAIALVMLAGMWIGRPAARLAVHMYVPPRLRGALGYLWIADGLRPPTTPSLPHPPRPPRSPGT